MPIILIDMGAHIIKRMIVKDRAKDEVCGAFVKYSDESIKFIPAEKVEQVSRPYDLPEVFYVDGFTLDFIKTLLPTFGRKRIVPAQLGSSRKLTSRLQSVEPSGRLYDGAAVCYSSVEPKSVEPVSGKREIFALKNNLRTLDGRRIVELRIIRENGKIIGAEILDEEGIGRSISADEFFAIMRADSNEIEDVCSDSQDICRPKPARRGRRKNIRRSCKKVPPAISQQSKNTGTVTDRTEQVPDARSEAIRHVKSHNLGAEGSRTGAAVYISGGFTAGGSDVSPRVCRGGKNKRMAGSVDERSVEISYSLERPSDRPDERRDVPSGGFQNYPLDRAEIGEIKGGIRYGAVSGDGAKGSFPDIGDLHNSGDSNRYAPHEMSGRERDRELDGIARRSGIQRDATSGRDGLAVGGSARSEKINQAMSHDRGLRNTGHSKRYSAEPVVYDETADRSRIAVFNAGKGGPGGYMAAGGVNGGAINSALAAAELREQHGAKIEGVINSDEKHHQDSGGDDRGDAEDHEEHQEEPA